MAAERPAASQLFFFVYHRGKEFSPCFFIQPTGPPAHRPKAQGQRPKAKGCVGWIFVASFVFRLFILIINSCSFLLVNDDFIQELVGSFGSSA